MSGARSGWVGPSAASGTPSSTGSSSRSGWLSSAESRGAGPPSPVGVGGANVQCGTPSSTGPVGPWVSTGRVVSSWKVVSIGGSGGPLQRVRNRASGAVWSAPLRHWRSMSNCIKRSDHRCIFGDRFRLTKSQVRAAQSVMRLNLRCCRYMRNYSMP